MKKFELFDDYLTQTIDAGEFNMRDVGNLIALAITECDTDYAAGITALEKAAAAYLKAPTAQQALEVFNGAIEHLDTVGDEL